jgi:hypothetical protein
VHRRPARRPAPSLARRTRRHRRCSRHAFQWAVGRAHQRCGRTSAGRCAIDRRHREVPAPERATGVSQCLECSSLSPRRRDGARPDVPLWARFGLGLVNHDAPLRGRREKSRSLTATQTY